MNINFINVLSSFYSDARRICGAEKTFHALFYHHLLLHGLESICIAREHNINGKKIDFVLFDKNVKGDFSSATYRGGIAFEFKGGAYGNRNALKDEVQQKSEKIQDLDKLAALKSNGTIGCFVCIDLPELGGSLSKADVKRIARQAGKKGLYFSYYNQADNYFLVSSPNGGLKPYVIRNINKHHSISDKTPKDIFREDGNLTHSLLRKARQIKGSEDNNVAIVYHLLRNLGYQSEQISLETYFNFASVKGSRMQWRPDISIFNSDVQGKFNLYSRGDRTKSNDERKLRNLLGLIEIKGSASTSKLSNNALFNLYMKDLEKLSRWRELVDTAKEIFYLNINQDPTYIFLGIDTRIRILPEMMLTDLHEAAGTFGVKFLYLPTNAA